MASRRPKPDLERQIMIGAFSLMAMSVYQVNKSLTTHVKTCEEASRNVRKVLWGVLLAVLTGVGTQVVTFIHFGVSAGH